jgi:hypothetical protein
MTFTSTHVGAFVLFRWRIHPCLVAKIQLSWQRFNSHGIASILGRRVP